MTTASKITLVRVVDAYDGELVGVLEEEYNDDCE